MHTDVLAGDSWTASDQFENPTELLREVTREPDPLSELRSIPFDRNVEGVPRAIGIRAGGREGARGEGTRHARRGHRKRRRTPTDMAAVSKRCAQDAPRGDSSARSSTAATSTIRRPATSRRARDSAKGCGSPGRSSRSERWWFPTALDACDLWGVPTGRPLHSRRPRSAARTGHQRAPRPPWAPPRQGGVRRVSGRLLPRRFCGPRIRRAASVSGCRACGRRGSGAPRRSSR
jgi:hypothetical protein